MQLIIIFTVLIFHYILFQTRGDVCIRYCEDLTPCKGHVRSRSRSCAPGRRRHEETERRRRRLPATSPRSPRSPRSPLPPPPTPEGSLGSTGGRIGRVKPDPAPRRSTGLLQHRPPPGSSRIPLVLDELRRSKRSPAPSAGAPSSPVGNIPLPPPLLHPKGRSCGGINSNPRFRAAKSSSGLLRGAPERDPGELPPPHGEPAAVPDSGWLFSCSSGCSFAARWKKTESSFRGGGGGEGKAKRRALRTTNPLSAAPTHFPTRDAVRKR